MTAGGEESDMALIKPGPDAIDVTPYEDRGIMKEIIKEGEGDAHPPPQSTVTLHYVAKLPDGSVFDTSETLNKPFECVLDKGIIIKAWDIGIKTMKKGEVARFICTPKYTSYYTNLNKKTIPKNTSMVFEITLVSWTPPDLMCDGGIIKTSTLETGKGYSTPKDGSQIKIHITGKHEDKVFEDRDVEFELGEGCEFGIVEGVEKALYDFKKGEKSVLLIKPKYAFGKEGNEELGVPPNATVEYTVKLENFTVVRTETYVSKEEVMEAAMADKEKAINYFKSNKYPLAAKFFKDALNHFNYNKGLEDDEMILTLRLNLGLVYLKMNECYNALEHLDEALKIDPQNVKGLFRRGQTYINIGEPEKAKSDFEAVVKIEPTNKLAANQIVICHNLMKQQREKEKKMYANIFEKLVKKDREGATTRYGWWDDDKKEPVIDEADPIDMEDVQEAKAEKRKQLERLKKLAQEKKEREEEERKKREAEEQMKEDLEGEAEEEAAVIAVANEETKTREEIGKTELESMAEEQEMSLSDPDNQ